MDVSKKVERLLILAPPKFYLEFLELDLKTFEFSRKLDSVEYLTWTGLYEYLLDQYGKEFINTWIVEIIGGLPVAVPGSQTKFISVIHT